MTKKLFIMIALVLAVVLGRVGFKVIQASGQFTELETTLADRCEYIDTAPGPEDIAIDHATGIAYFAATDRRVETPRPRGSIYRLDLNDPSSAPVEVLGDVPADFFAHGLSLWRDPEGVLRLFAVNHPKSGETVEIFEVANDEELEHVETVTSDAMYALNDVVAVGPRQFYATNDQRYKDGIGAILEVFLGLPLGELIYFDGDKGTKAVGGFAFANGVNVSLDGTQVYVAETIGRKLAIFDRDTTTGALNGRRNHNIGSGLDNIDVAPDGSLYIGAHPKLLAFTAHAEDPQTISPSEVIKFDPNDGSYETVYVSKDGELNGSATGAYWKGTLLVGGVFDPHIARCDNVKS